MLPSRATEISVIKGSWLEMVPSNKTTFCVFDKRRRSHSVIYSLDKVVRALLLSGMKQTLIYAIH